jgi:hypothetical protein
MRKVPAIARETCLPKVPLYINRFTLSSAQQHRWEKKSDTCILPISGGTVGKVDMVALEQSRSLCEELLYPQSTK